MDNLKEKLKKIVSKSSSSKGSFKGKANVLGTAPVQAWDAKFRRLRLTNPRIQEAVVDVSGGLEPLLACGFEVVFEEGATAAGGSNADAEVASGEGYAVLADSAELGPLQHALHLLAPLLPPKQSQAAAPAAPAAMPPAAGSAGGGPAAAASPQQRAVRQQRVWEAPRPRNTQARDKRGWIMRSGRESLVVLPTSIEADVPDWFFQRSGQELKAAFLSAVRRREQASVLTTRATRQRLAGGGAQPTSGGGFATIKVRFPEGLSLQGEFGAGEPLAALFAWVADCLSDPLNTFELVQPNRQPLTHSPVSVREADLLPSTALLFRWTDQSAVTMAHVPALRPELLQAARPATANY
ncbi:Plant UBX domain-containing protein 2 [Chlorella vulgaris]